MLDIDRLAGTKNLQGCWLILDDGRELIVSYRPIPKYFPYVERRVVVTGRHYMPEGQAVDAEHFEVESIKLAKGQEKGEDDRLPTPSSVLTKDDLPGREGRWVQLHGKVTKVEAESYYWFIVELELSEGTVIHAPSISRDWDPESLLGKEISVISRLFHKPFEHSESVDETRTPWIGGPVSMCPGKVQRCGME